MALTRDSVLFYWDSRYGIAPVVGGDVLYGRDSAAWTRDRQGLLRSMLPNFPRFAWRTVDGATQPALVLEGSSTNLVPNDSLTFEGQWAAYGGAVATITQGQTLPGISPAGMATRVQTTGGSSVLKYIIGLTTVAAGGEYAIRLWARNQGASAVEVATNVAGSTSILPGETKQVAIATANTQAGDRQIQLRAAAAADDVDVIVFQPMAEALAFSASFADGARAADRCSWSGAPSGVAMAGYLRFAAGIPGAAWGGSRVWMQLGVGGVTPRLLLYEGAGADTARLIYSSYSGQTVATMSPAVGIARGDTVELVPLIYADGSVRLIGAARGGPAWDSGIAAGPSSGLAEAWSDDRLHLNALDDSGSNSAGHDYMDMRWVRLTDLDAALADKQAVLDEMRALLLSPAGDLL